MTFHGPAVYPEYMTDYNITLCPSDPMTSVIPLDEQMADILAGTLDSSENAAFSNGDLNQDGNFNGTDVAIWACVPRSYMYTAWAVKSDEEIAGVLEAIEIFKDSGDGKIPGMKGMPPFPDADNDIVVDGSFAPWEFNGVSVNPCGTHGSDTVFRLREGIERFFITDINNPAASAVGQSELAVMWDFFASAQTHASGGFGQGVQKFNHLPGGCNVLFLDGHVDFIKFGDEEFPISMWLAGFLGDVKYGGGH
ncbi:MAG: hypothetical protein JXR94_05635 [Candidatus Hydrogenedentes bacterium]|nr:hypothetical protein [Candidatus Hydrogenedentota bacterium]